MQFSLQPDPDTRAIERALVADPAKLKEHGLTARMREEQPDVFGTVAKGLYATYSDADAIRHAQAWLGQRTEAEATATLMSLKLGQADKMTMTAAQLLTEKLAGEGRIGEASDLARSTATIATTMGQAIQSLHMMMRLGDEAAMLTFAAKEIVDAAKEKATTQEMTAAMSAMEGLRNLLEKEQAQNGYLSMIQHQAAIIEAAEVAQAQLESEIRSLVDALTRANTPAQRADLQQRIDELDLKLRMLEQTSRHELGKTREEIAKLRAALAKARAQLADLTGRGAERHLAEAIRIIEAARGLTTERQVELQKKIQSALTSDDGTDTAATRITGALIAAGMDRGKAQALAKKLVDTFRARSKQVRDSVLKQLAEGAAPKLTARIDRGVISKWQTANKHGHLDDAKLFEGIAKRWGFPVFTVADAAKVKDLVRQYNSTTNPEVRIMLATEMLDWMSRKAAHSNILDKARALFTLTKLMSFKTLERIFMSNTVAALAQTIAVDVPRIVLTATGSIFTGGKLVDTDTALGAMGTGLRETARIFKAGRVHGIEEGQNGVMAGMKTLIAAAKAHTSSINDARDLRKMAGSVFSSRAMRNMETMMHLVLSVPDYPRFAGEVKQSLARQMRAEGNEVPTAEQYKRAYLAGQRSIWLNYENAAKTASGLAKAINRISTLGITEKFGLGTVVSPFTRVPPNMLADALRWTPIGFIQAMYEGVMEAKNPEAGDQREAVNALLKAAAGTGALAVGAYLFRLGIVTGDDDDDRNIQNLRNATGWQKWSVNTSELSRRMETGDWTSPGTKPVEGDVFESFAWMQPAATIVAAGAAMEQKAQDRTTKGEPPAGWWTPFVDSLGGIKSFGDMPMVTGFSRLAQDMRQLEDSGKVAPLIAAYTRMFDFVPAIVRDIRYANNDAVSETRDANAVQAEWNRIIGQVTPDQLPQRYDILGRAQTKYDAARGSILKALIDPMTERVFRNTPAAAEALRLAESTGLTGQIPDKATTRIAINTSLRPGDTITRELNAREISELQRLMGTMSADLTTLAMLNPAYATMPDEARAKMLASNVAAGNTAAKMYLFGHVPGELTASGLQTDSRAILAFAIAQFRGIIPKDATIQKPVFPATK